MQKGLLRGLPPQVVDHAGIGCTLVAPIPPGGHQVHGRPLPRRGRVEKARSALAKTSMRDRPVDWYGPWALSAHPRKSRVACATRQIFPWRTN